LYRARPQIALVRARCFIQRRIGAILIQAILFAVLGLIPLSIGVLQVAVTVSSVVDYDGISACFILGAMCSAVSLVSFFEAWKLLVRAATEEPRPPENGAAA
jgi:hypothetical protein